MSILRSIAQLTLLIAGAVVVTSAWGQRARPDSLLAVDQNRNTVVERIVGQWGEPLAQSSAGITALQLREMLNVLRADYLLGASLAGSLSGLRDVLATAVVSTAPVKANRVSAKALGDATDDLVYTPVTPCRLFDTRASQGGLGTPSLNLRRTYGAITPVAMQGGPGGCAAATGSAVALIQIGTLTPSGNGILQGGPQGAASLPNALILYQGGDQYGTAVAMPLNATNGQFDLLEQFATADLYGDLLGYLAPPKGGYVLPARASRRAALNQWWTPQTTNAMQTISTGTGQQQHCAADGEYIWLTNLNQLFQVQASTGTILGTWIGAAFGEGVLAAAGKVFMAGSTSPAGPLYVLDSAHPPASGMVTVAASNLGNGPVGIAFDGAHLWTANFGGSVSIITPQATLPYPVTTVTAGFTNPYGILYDGAHIWVTDINAGTLLKLDASGNILQTVTVGAQGPEFPAFDGVNIWVPKEGDNSIIVVQASTGNVVATITADATNLLNGPTSASFDGERILVTNSGGNSVTVFKAADLSFIANVTTGVSSVPFGACSDGINFWVTDNRVVGANLLRF